MRVTVDAVYEADGESTVAFSSVFGSAAGVWRGDVEAVAGADYEVEFDLDEPISWGESARPGERPLCAIDVTASGARFAGLLESLDDDGYAVMRMEQYIVPFIAEGIPDAAVGGYVIVESCRLEIYPWLG